MLAGDVRERRSPVVIARMTVRAVLRSIRQPWNRTLLFVHPNQFARIVSALGAAEMTQVGAKPGLQEDARRRRGCPRDLLHAGRMSPGRCRRFRRRRRISPQLAVQTELLFVPEQIELVAGSRLQRHPRATVGPEAVVDGLPVLVSDVGPRVRLPGILVVEPILEDWTAERSVHVPQFDQLLWSAQSLILQRLRVVAALHGAVGRVDEKRSFDRVGARARDDAHDRTADFRFSQTAGGAEDDLLSVTDVRDVIRHAAAALRRSD